MSGWNGWLADLALTILILAVVIQDAINRRK